MAVMKIDSFSAAMGRNISFLAAGPLESLKAGQKMRALYLLHGVTGAASNWFSLTAASRKAIEANSHRAAGKDPVCLISLSGGNGFYHPVPDKRDGAWRPGADHKHDYQAFIGQEIVSLTRKMLPISDKREDTGILGLSMGGYGALRTGLLYRQTFGFAAGLSCALLTRIPTEDEGAFWLRPDFEKVIFGPDGPSLEDDVEDLAISLAKEGQTLPRLMVACGTEDSLLAYNRQLDQDWKKAGIEHDYLEHPGAHEWAFWEWGLEKRWKGSDMGKFDGILLCTDCDGTLTHGDLEVCPEDVEAIRYFQKEGGLFTFATGRFPKHVRNFSHLFDLSVPAVMANGTTLYDASKDRVVGEVVLDPKPRQPLFYAKEQGLSHMIFIEHRTYSVIWTDLNDPNTQKELQKTLHVERLEEFFDDREPDRFPEPWHKTDLVFDTPEQNLEVQKTLKERFPGWRYERSWPTGLEILPPEGGKGNGVKRLKKMLGSKVRLTVCVGDFENDVSMLKEADIGYAVGNADPVTKKAADKITVDCLHGPMSHIIRDLEEAKYRV